MRRAAPVPALEYEVVRDIAALGALVWDVIVIRGAEVFLARKWRAGSAPDAVPGYSWAGDDVKSKPDGVYVVRRFAGDALPLVGLYHQHLQARGDAPQLWTFLVERSGVLPAPRLSVSSNPDPKPSRRKKRPALRVLAGGLA